MMKICLNITLKCKLIIFISLLVISCNKEDLQEISERPTGKLSDGFELLPVTKKLISGNFIKNEKQEVLAQINEKITVRHLQELGYYYPYVNQPLCNMCNDWNNNRKAKACENKLKSLFRKSGKTPISICINDFTTRYGAVLSNKYGLYAYIKTGEPKIIDKKIDVNSTRIDSSWAINYATDRDMAYNISYSVTTSKTAYWENIGSTTVCVGGKVGLPFVSEGQVNVTLGYSHVEGKSETTSKTYSYTPWIYLAPRTKKRVMIIQKDITRTIKYEIPILISGEVVASFINRVDGHYDWSLPADLLLKDKGDKLIYEIRIEDIGDVEVYGGKEVPLD